MSTGAVRRAINNPAAGMEIHEISTNHLGAMDTMLPARTCTLDSCESAAVAVLAEQNLCLSHFFSYCYARLEKFDPRTRKSGSPASDVLGKRRFVEECSRAVLDLSFRCETLSNLQRARLLDILLWAGELFVLLRLAPPEKAKALQAPSGSPDPNRR